MVAEKRRARPLTKDELFGRALSLIDSEGLPALTMRRLASDVGVEAASLYHHIPNKEALLDGVLMRMRAEIQLPDPLPADWMDLMEAIFLEYHRMLARHPNLMPLAGRRVEGDPTSGLLFLVQMGFSDEDAVGLWQSVIAFSAGYALFASPLAESDVTDLPPGLAARMRDWNEQTYHRTLRMLLEGYDRERTGEAAGQGFSAGKKV